MMLALLGPGPLLPLVVLVSVVVVLEVVGLDVVAVAGLGALLLSDSESPGLSTTTVVVLMLGTSALGYQRDQLHTRACRPHHQTIDRTSTGPTSRYWSLEGG